jgi:hypothetical protein
MLEVKLKKTIEARSWPKVKSMKGRHLEASFSSFIEELACVYDIKELLCRTKKFLQSGNVFGCMIFCSDIYLIVLR